MKDGKPHHNSRDLTGLRFGMLTVERRSHTDGKKWYWQYRCDCGKACIKNGSDVSKDIKKGRTPNCGCMTKQLIGRAQITHGMSKTDVYAVYRSMIDRCRLPSHQAWANYGGRGITVCERWQQGFENFWADMAAGYRKGLELERVDNSKGYSPQNCTWVSCKRQANNKRTNVSLRMDSGEVLNVSQAAELHGIGLTTLLYRIAHNWPSDRLFIPPNPKNRGFGTS
jgi:hypothetical protein